MTSEKLEKELHEIIKSGNPQAVTIDGKRTYISKKIINKLKENEELKEGGLLPLAALIPLIAGLIGGAGAAAGGVAGVVQSVKSSQKDDAQKKLAEEQLLQLKKEKETKETKEKSGDGVQSTLTIGQGIFLDPYQGKGLSDFLRNILKNSNL